MTVNNPQLLPARDDLAFQGRGIVSESTPFNCLTASAFTTPTQQLTGSLVGLRAGDTVTGIIFDASIAALTITLAQVALYSGAGVLLGNSADFSGTIGSSGLKTIPLTAPVAIPTSGGYYLCILSVYSAGTLGLFFTGAAASALGFALNSGLRADVAMAGQAALPSQATFAGGTNACWFAAY